MYPLATSLIIYTPSMLTSLQLNSRTITLPSRTLTITINQSKASSARSKRAAAGNTNYSPNQLVATTFQILFATGMFLENFQTWKRKPNTDKTWANFKTYLSLVHRKFCETRTTTAGSGFAAANSAEILLSYQPNAAYQQETIEAIANLTSAISLYRESVTTLTAIVATLATKLATTNAKLIKALVETTKLKATVGELRPTMTKPCGSY